MREGDVEKQIKVLQQEIALTGEKVEALKPHLQIKSKSLFEKTKKNVKI